MQIWPEKEQKNKKNKTCKQCKINISIISGAAYRKTGRMHSVCRLQMFCGEVILRDGCISEQN